MTLRCAKEIVKGLGFRLTHDTEYNEYQIILKPCTKAHTDTCGCYMTDDLSDAVGTAKLMARWNANEWNLDMRKEVI